MNLEVEDSFDGGHFHRFKSCPCVTVELTVIPYEANAFCHLISDSIAQYSIHCWIFEIKWIFIVITLIVRHGFTELRNIFSINKQIGGKAAEFRCIGFRLCHHVCVRGGKIGQIKKIKT